LGRNGNNVETIDLTLSEIFQVYLVVNYISQLQLLATKYSLFVRVQGAVKINYYMSKICHDEPQNLANWPTEFGKICRGNLWSLMMLMD